jgi:hypothetical protein
MWEFYMKIYEYYINLKTSELELTEHEEISPDVIGLISFNEIFHFSKNEATVFFPFKLNKHQENKIEKMIAYKIIYGKWKMH